MEFIPVVDLMDGRAVHARWGERARYQPVDSPWSGDGSPQSLVAGLLACYPFRTLYIADLDAIQNRGDHFSLVAELKQRHPDVEFWVDGGFRSAGAVRGWASRGLGPAVVGTESWQDDIEVDAPWPRDTLLSLDFQGTALRGDARWLAPATWPDRVIAMTLARVGSEEGPDLSRLAELRGRAGGRALYAAGGVRDEADLHSLRAIGVQGVLLATALHSGQLDAQALGRCAAAA